MVTAESPSRAAISGDGPLGGVPPGGNDGCSRSARAEAVVAGAEPGSLSELASELRVVLGRLLRLSRRLGAGQGLAPPLLSALATLDTEGPLSPSELAEMEGVSKASVTPVLAALESQGLASRTPHPTDGRQCSVAITTNGKKVLAAERARKDAWLAQRLSGLEPAQQAAVARALAALRLVTKA